MQEDASGELMAIVASAAEHLRHELDLGNPLLPRLEARAPAHAPSPAPAAVEAPAPRAAAVAPPRLEVLAAEARTCTRCRLHQERTQSVFARGSERAPVVFVGEGPGYQEDQQGLPFVGPAGQLLDKMIAAMGLSADEIYICNVVKCRPPNNRTPNPDEAAACRPYLEAQLEVVAPQVIVALGRCAAENLGAEGRGWRGAWTTWKGIRVMSTYHPAYLLRSPEQKRVVWQDLQAVVKALGRELPARS